MVHFFLTCRKFLLGAAVNYGGFCSEPQGCAGCVHCHVSASHNHEFVSCVNRSVIIVAICLHQIVAGEEFVCGEDSVELLARNVHKSRKTSSGTNEHGLEALLVQKAVHSDGTSCNHVGFELHSQSLHLFDFSCHHLALRKTELRNTVFQHSSRTVQGLENGHVITHLGKV